MKEIGCNDYYAKEYFDNPKYEYLGFEEVSHGTCPFCGGTYTSFSAYLFKDTETDEQIRVNVYATYGICNMCGAC
jgi:hypothetical protein